MTDARDAWLAEVTRWIEASLRSIGLGSRVVVTPIRERAWSAVARVEASGRVMFFKAEGPGARHEPVILADIALTHPQLVPEPIATDLDRGWLLMADHGTAMWDSVDPAGEIAVWEGMFPLYGNMQRLTAPDVERWIAAGAPDRRLNRLPELVEDLLARDAVSLDSGQRRAVGATIPDLDKVCRDLAATDVTAAIDHSDMHGNNVLVGRGSPRLVD
jgi:hypothetical protein